MLHHYRNSERLFHTADGRPTPLAIDGVVAWFNTDDPSIDVCESGRKVSAWIDKTGNGNDVTQGNISLQPDIIPGVLHNYSCIRFDGTALLQAVSPPSTPSGDLGIHIFAVGSVSATVASGSSLVAYSGPVSPGQEAISLDAVLNNNSIRMVGSSDGGTLLQSEFICPGGLFLDTPFIAEGSIRLLRQGNELLAHKNGSINAGQGGLPGSGLIGGASLRFGSSRDNLIKPLFGDLVEVIIYERELSFQERNQINAYLGHKFNIPLELI